MKKNDSSTGHWSGFVKHLDRIVFKDELPTYAKKIHREERATPSTSTTNKPTKKRHEDKELKHSLGDALKGLKDKM